MNKMLPNNRMQLTRPALRHLVARSSQLIRVFAGLEEVHQG